MIHILEVEGESNFLAIEAGPLRTAFNIDCNKDQAELSVW